MASFLAKHFPLLIESGQCPTQQMMRDTGIDPSAFLKHFGGTAGICERLNLVPATGFKTRDGHFVRSYYELLLDEYLYSRGIEHTPEVELFEDCSYRCDQKIGDFYVEIWGYPPKCKSYHDRRKKKKFLYKKHNLQLISIEHDLFNGTPNVIEERLNDIFEKLSLPTTTIRSFLMSDIAKQISYPWTEDTIRKHIESYIEEYAEFPTQKRLRKHGLAGLADRIAQFGGFKYFREFMGYGQWVKPDRKWSQEKIVSKLKKLCEKLGRFPKDQELPSDLRNAIRRCAYVDAHDLNWYREKFGYNITKKSNGHWTEEVIEKELQVVIGESDGVFPTNSYLKKIGRYDLTSAIQSSGGFNHWRQKLSFPIMQNSPNQYNDNDLTDWFGKCVEKFDQIPTVEQLKSVDSRKQSAIGRRGGMYKFACRLVEQDGRFVKYLDDYKSRNGINGLVRGRLDLS